MAMITSEAAASVKTHDTEIHDTETQCVAYASPFLPELIWLMGSYMDDADLENFSKLDFILFPVKACQKECDNRKYIRENILPHVFKATPNGLAAFLAQPGSKNMSIPKMLLTKAGFNEGYESVTLQKFICFRSWRGVSALTAAAYSGDEFFVIRILAHLVQDNTYRLEALQQLEEVEKQITEQTLREYNMLVDALTEIVTIEFGEDDVVKKEAKLRLEQFKSSKEFQRLIGDQSIVEEAIAAGFTPSKDTAGRGFIRVQEVAVKHQRVSGERKIKADAGDQKVSSERKERAENAPIQYAEDAEFLTPVLRLLKAYINVLILDPKSYEKPDWNAIVKLWEIVSECHKRLFRNVLQEFFDPEKPFLRPFFKDTTVDFGREPSRAPSLYRSGAPLNLDGIGRGTNYGLYKWGPGVGILDGWDMPSCRPGCDLHPCRAIITYFKRRTTGLKNIIEQLKTPDTAEALVAPYVNSSLAAKAP